MKKVINLSDQINFCTVDNEKLLLFINKFLREACTRPA